jgi:hypothetical protein
MRLLMCMRPLRPPWRSRQPRSSSRPWRPQRAQRLAAGGAGAAHRHIGHHAGRGGQRGQRHRQPGAVPAGPFGLQLGQKARIGLAHQALGIAGRRASGVEYLRDGSRHSLQVRGVGVRASRARGLRVTRGLILGGAVGVSFGALTNNACAADAAVTFLQHLGMKRRAAIQGDYVLSFDRR